MIGLADRADGVRVGRLTLRGSDLDPGVARLRAEHVLGAADLRPAGLPPHAILLVRRIRDPAPRRLSLERGTHLPPRDWEAALRSRLADLYRGAARPARGSVASDADAVVFADEAELLAAYAVDVLDGRAADAWWWRTVFGARAPSVGGLGQALASTPTAVPALVEALDRRGRARALLLRLDEAATWRVVRAVADAFGVGALATELAEAPAALPPATEVSPWRPDQSHNDRGSVGGGRSTRTAAGVRGRSTGTAVGVGASDPLPWNASVLLELARALRRNPAGLSASSFARDVRAVYLATAGVAPAAVTESLTTPSRAVGDLTPDPAVDDARRTAPADLASPAMPRAIEPATHSGQAVEDADAPLRQASRLPDRAAATRDPAASVEGAVGSTAGDDRAAADAAALVPGERTSGPASSPDASLAAVPDLGLASVPTELAGVFYLVNVMVRLDLPDAFEADWRLASSCGAWGTLELLARGLLAGRRGYGADGLWRALAGLGAHPDGHVVGDKLMRPSAAVIPSSWSFIGGPTRVSRRQVRATGLCHGLSPAARSWQGLVLPHIRQLLGVALGSPGDPRAIVEMLARPGRLRVTDTHVDVEMALEDIAVSVRKAGLDRDPGWLPAFGRTIRLHYE